MKVADLFKVRTPEIRALHLTWIAFFITFYVWFNMAPLATSMLRDVDWLTQDHIRLFAICNVALTIPARIIVGMALDRFGPRRVFSILMVSMAIPALAFAFGNTFTQLLVARLVLSSIGASFVVGIHMTALWFKPKHIGFAEGFYAGWGNFGSAAAAMTLPTIAIVWYGGDEGWRWTIALVGCLAILVWRIQDMGFMSVTAAVIAYLAILAIVVYQVVQILRVNVPILKKGVPEDDKYHFNSVAALNTTYFANFGAELAVISMLPMFFEQTWGLTAAAAGLIASSFAFVNLVARPMGGAVSDRMGNRRFVMLSYMFGIGIGFTLMGMMNETWPLILAIAITIFTSFFVQGSEGATFGIIPSIKRRITGQISGMAGAYGNVGAVVYLTLFTFVTPTQFFYILAAGAFFSWLVCFIWLKEPESGFADEYYLSSVDKMLEEQEQLKAEGKA